MEKANTILQISDLTKDGNKRLNELFNVVPLSQLENYQDSIKAIVTTGGVTVDASLIEKLPNLELIGTRGVGFDHIDLKAASKKGILITNTPDVLTDCVADLAFGALIAISRDIVQADSFVRSGKWLNDKFSFSTKVTGKNLGIVGFGRIGQAILKRASGFNMKLKYYSRTQNPNFKRAFEPSLIELAKWADYLVVCTPGGKETEGLISLEVLKALGKNGYLINISRGSVVDENALIDVITNEKIAGAALDVFLHEPVVPDELLVSKSVILLPHIASRTKETFIDMENLLLENLEKYFKTGTLSTQVEG